MLSRVAALVCLGLLIAPLANARDLILGLPIDCTLGRDCFVQNYMDRDEGPGAADFTCGPLSYDNHHGTDFAIPGLAAMKQGVNVLASAPGLVRAVRDNQPDIPSDAPNAPDIKGRECGNGVLIDHGKGWETQYCHLKRGTILVRPGQRLAKGAILGQVGLSGDSQFPHVHLSVRHEGKDIDPFNPESFVSCGIPPVKSLWQETVPYIPGGLIAVGFSAHMPDFREIKAGPSPMLSLSADAPAIVLWGHAFGGRKGDTIELEISGPDGKLVSTQMKLEKTQARFFRATGKRLTGARWPAGRYTGTIRLVRKNREISRKSALVMIAE